MRIVKICEYCKNDFIAKKTSSKTCSDDCAKRLYKLNQRNKKIHQEELKTEIKRKPEAYIIAGVRNSIIISSLVKAQKR
jgi:hypothetical protein